MPDEFKIFEYDDEGTRSEIGEKLHYGRWTVSK